MKLGVLNQKHACGGCTVCCQVMGLQDLGKPYYVSCEHRAAAGCGIYDNRPRSCRDFVCAWAAGLTADAPAWRPDQSGLLAFLRRESDGLWLEIYEAAPGAATDLKKMDYLIQRISSRVERVEKIRGTRLHHYGDAIGLGFAADAAKYPTGAAVSFKSNRYDWISGDGSRQVFREAHEPD